MVSFEFCWQFFYLDIYIYSPSAFSPCSNPPTPPTPACHKNCLPPQLMPPNPVQCPSATVRLGNLCHTFMQSVSDHVSKSVRECWHLSVPIMTFVSDIIISCSCNRLPRKSMSFKMHISTAFCLVLLLLLLVLSVIKDSLIANNFSCWV